MNRKIVIQKTEDGSNTLYLPDLDETYHSTHGSVQEAELVFIKYGLRTSTKSNLSILEIGFGTGLNAYLTLLDSINNPNIRNIRYTSIELYPVDMEVVKQLNYSSIIQNSNQELFLKLHLAEWGDFIAIHNKFKLKKINADFTEIDLSGKYDLIYYDAFGPDKQCEMWDEKLFQKLFEVANEGAIITTYSAKGNVRRALQKAGFIVERLPGPIGKREVLRAIKKG